MNDLKRPLNWEEFFIQEAVELEEKMKLLDEKSLNKSKLRLALENSILDWEAYEKWSQKQTGCASLKVAVREKDLSVFFEKSYLAFESYSNHSFWSEDLIPFLVWDDQLIVLGLNYNEQLVTIKDFIFILTPPALLKSLFKKLQKTAAEKKASGNLELIEHSNSNSNAVLEGVNLDIEASTLNFNIKEMNSIFSNNDKTPSAAEEKSNVEIWEFISERHQEYSFEVKKQFDAFVILKLAQDKTQVFKIDNDLSEVGINPVIFEYNVTEKNPFNQVISSGKTGVFTLEQLEISLVQFKNVCITPLKRGPALVGFFLGFKKDKLSDKDRNLLEELAQETAS